MIVCQCLIVDRLLRRVNEINRGLGGFRLFGFDYATGFILDNRLLNI